MAVGRGSIRSDELLRLSEAGRREGWGERLLSDLQKAGLPVVVIGRTKYVVGRWVIEFVERELARQQRDQQAPSTAAPSTTDTATDAPRTVVTSEEIAHA